MTGGQGKIENFVLTEKTGEERTAGKCKGTDEHGGIGNWHLLAQPAHLPDVLLMMQGADHRTGAEKEQGLEEGMGENMKDACRIAATPTPANI